MEEIKRNPLPEMECGMAYLAHPTLPTLPSLKARKYLREKLRRLM
nr:MAG TPA: hypothetical protein [Caudoviricetes sp.]